MNSNTINTKDNIEFVRIISELINNPKVQEMANYRQHYTTSCLQHCLEVSYISYLICKNLGLDYVSAARAGLLHDLFLYDWRLPHEEFKSDLQGLHAFAHPKIALKNAKKLFPLNNKEKDIILTHMWPVTFFKFPKYKESYIITLVDKYSALRSSKNYHVEHLRSMPFLQYAYLLIAIVITKINL